MGDKALVIFRAVFMVLMLVALAVFMILHIKAGLDTQNSKLLLAGYVLLLIWAGVRVFVLVKEILRK